MQSGPARVLTPRLLRREREHATSPAVVERDETSTISQKSRQLRAMEDEGAQGERGETRHRFCVVAVGEAGQAADKAIEIRAGLVAAF
jgi:hypothetical protein